MLRLSDTWSWTLMGIVILVLLFKDHSLKEGLWLLAGALLCILLADQLSSGLIKPLFARPRPCQDPQIMYQLRCLAGRGDAYSFPSSHAANNFALITYLALMFRDKITAILLYFWALCVCYSRIYLAMHYFSDVLCGALLGLVVGLLIYFVGVVIYKRFYPPKTKYYSDAYTRTGYKVSDLQVLYSAITLTFLYVII